jgi:hypothetical protein
MIRDQQLASVRDSGRRRRRASDVATMQLVRGLGTVLALAEFR